MSKLKVTLVHSANSASPDQRETVRGLGLRTREQEVVVEDTPSMRGMVEKVEHLVEVERVED